MSEADYEEQYSAGEEFDGQPNVPRGVDPDSYASARATEEAIRERAKREIEELIEDNDGAPLPPGLQPGASKDNPRKATTIETEYVASLRAQTRAAAQQEVALAAVEVAHDSMGQYFEEARLRIEDDKALTLDERRRWHALACIAENGDIVHSTRQTMDAADKYARWLETGHIPPQ